MEVAAGCYSVPSDSIQHCVFQPSTIHPLTRDLCLPFDIIYPHVKYLPYHPTANSSLVSASLPPVATLSH